MKKVLIILFLFLISIEADAQIQNTDSLTIEQRVDSLERSFAALNIAFGYSTLIGDLSSLYSTIRNHTDFLVDDIHRNRFDNQVLSLANQLSENSKENIESIEDSYSELNYQFMLNSVLYQFNLKELERIIYLQEETKKKIKLAKAALDYLNLCAKEYAKYL